MTTNRKVAQMLERVAAVFRVREGASFRAKAYENAAAAIDNLTEPVDQLWKQGKINDIPGIGEKMQTHLNEYFKTGHVRHFDSQFKKVPVGMFALMEIRNIGPITAYKIAKKFRLNDEKTAEKELKILLKENKLTKIPSFKEKSIARLKKSLKYQQAGTGRELLSKALPIALEYINYLKKSPDIFDVEPLGSLRRRLPTVGDIDLAVNTPNPDEALKFILNYPQIESVISKGIGISRVKLKNGYEIDIKISLPDNWGSMLQHFTGSKMHNIKLRTLALKKGLSLSEGGIKKGKKHFDFKTEKDFYSFLDLPYIPPEIREDEGEIELAIKGKIPELVKMSDIKGDLHIHSDFDFPSSHDSGVSPISDLLTKAHQLGYEYIGIADHNPKYIGLSEKEKKNIIMSRRKYLEDGYRAYEKRVKNSTIKLLIGMEVDIRLDGKLALSDELMESLDYVIASIHAGFDEDKEVNTGRILSALQHPKVRLIGHPMGRKLNGREGMALEWDKIFDFCLENNKYLEINAYPDRLDPPDVIIKSGVNKGVKFILNTDSHADWQMNFMEYGVWAARKGYAQKSDLINSLSWKNLQTVLK